MREPGSEMQPDAPVNEPAAVAGGTADPGPLPPDDDGDRIAELPRSAVPASSADQASEDDAIAAELDELHRASGPPDLDQLMEELEPIIEAHRASAATNRVRESGVETDRESGSQQALDIEEPELEGEWIGGSFLDIPLGRVAPTDHAARRRGEVSAGSGTRTALLRAL
jgi:hypothetical protein